MGGDREEGQAPSPAGWAQSPGASVVNAPVTDGPPPFTDEIPGRPPRFPGGDSPWSGMFDPIGAPAAVKAPGLGQFEVVADDFKGPLMPNQIRQSQHDELAKYGFGQMKVLDPAAAAAAQKPGGRLGNDEMTQDQFVKLSRSWLAMSEGKGMKMSGSAADIDSFKKMMSATMMDSPTMRNLLTDIGASPASQPAFDVNLGHSQPRVLIDSFKTGALDLDDLGALPSAHDANLPRNSITRDDQLVHILAERQAAAQAKNASRPAGTPAPTQDQLFQTAHPVGMGSQNAYRAERGQLGVKDTGTDSVIGTQTTISHYQMTDNTEEYIHAVNAGTIDNIIPPGPRRRP